MKYLIIINLLITLNVDAQEDKVNTSDEKLSTQKRPSWSQGLPERQSSINPLTSMNALKTKTESEKISKDDLKLNTQIPNLDLDIATSEAVMELEIEPIKHNILTREDAFDQYYSSDQKVIKDQSNETINPLIAAYKWTPIKTSPINVSESFDTNEALQLNIQINPKGEVTRVTGVDNSIPRNIFKNAEKSILKWKFEAPEELGITEEISRTFTIDITTEA